MRVLIVEDSIRIRERLQEALREIDNTAIAGCADTEEEALALMSREPWDLVLLDLQLKRGNGLGVLERWRSAAGPPQDARRGAMEPRGHAGGRLGEAVQGRRAGMRRMRGKVAVFTNYAFPQYRARALELGADYFFDKAREFHRMLELVAGLAGAAAANRRLTDTAIGGRPS